MNKPRSLYILIDDDETNNLLTDFFIRDVDPLASVYAFSDAEVGLLQLTEFLYVGHPCVLLLDINMPVLSGWDVLENLEHLPERIRKNLTVAMLSSSVGQDDKRRALSNALVMDYFEKPLTVDKVVALTKASRSKSAA